MASKPTTKTTTTRANYTQGGLALKRKKKKRRPRQCEATYALCNLLFYCFNSNAEQSHKDTVRKTSCWNLKRKTVQLTASMRPQLHLPLHVPPMSSDIGLNTTCNSLSMDLYTLMNREQFIVYIEEGVSHHQTVTIWPTYVNGFITKLKNCTFS